MPPLALTILQLIATYGIPAAIQIVDSIKNVKTVEDVTPDMWAKLIAKVKTPYEEFLKAGNQS